jgi:hypothetical protein
LGYLGNVPSEKFLTTQKDRFTGLTGSTVTLSHSVSSISDIIVWVNSVKQDYNSLSVSGTTLTLGGALVSDDVVQVAYIGRTVGTKAPAVGTVTNSMLANSSITLNGSAVSLGGSATISSGAGSVETWVNFNGTGTPSIRGSGNVSSISDNGTGSYTVNFSNNLTDANYAVVACGDRETGERQIVVLVDQNNGGQSNSSVGIATINNDNPYRDAEIVGIGILR